MRVFLSIFTLLDINIQPFGKPEAHFFFSSLFVFKHGDTVNPGITMSRLGRIRGTTLAVGQLPSLIVTLLIILQMSIVSAYPHTLSPVSPLRKGVSKSPAPEYDFPGSITICRRDYYEDCTTLVEAPASIQRRCTQVPAGFDERISSFEVKNGCCEFFSSIGCAGGRLLIGCNEKKPTLFGFSNNRISSWKCYFGDK